MTGVIVGTGRGHRPARPRGTGGPNQFIFHRNGKFSRRRKDPKSRREQVSQGMPTIQIIEKRLHRHPGPGKARSPTHDPGINDDDAGLHARTLAYQPPSQDSIAATPTLRLQS